MHFYVENPGDDPGDTYQRTVQNGTSFQLPGKILSTTYTVTRQFDVPSTLFGYHT